MYLLNGYKTDIDSVTCLVCGMTFKEVFTFIYGVSIKVYMSSWSLIFCLLSVGSECNKIQPWNTVKHEYKNHSREPENVLLYTG